MKNRLWGIWCLILGIVLICSGNAFGGEIFLAPKVGTQGVGADLGYAISDTFKVRGNVNGYKYTYEDDYEGIDYDVDFNLLSAGLLLDWHPFENGFRVTGGLYYNGNNADGTADVDSMADSYEIGDTTYTGAALDALGVSKLDMDVEFNPIAPYLGLGWGSGTGDSKWFFNFDLGVMYVGEADVDLDSNGENIPAALRDDIETERSDLEDELAKYCWYPVVAIGVGYRF